MLNYVLPFFRLARFLETAGSVLNYFEAFLGRIEIMGSSKTIERVYFEIPESNIEQWEKPQIKVEYFLLFDVGINIQISSYHFFQSKFRNRSVPSSTLS